MHVLTMMYDTGVSDPLFADEKGYTLTPPVLRPMRSVNSMKDSLSVPICSRSGETAHSTGTGVHHNPWWCIHAITIHHENLSVPCAHQRLPNAHECGTMHVVHKGQT
jgi:hypothetical protein